MAAPAMQTIQQGSNATFDLQRKKAQQQEMANTQAARDAIARRSAALGGAPGGAMIKQEQLAINAGADRLAAANEGINAAQNQEQQRLAEVAQGQEFQRGEREATQGWQQGNIDKQQALAVQQAAFQNKLSEAGLTGTYGGQQTLAGKQSGLAQQTFDYTKGQDQKEFEQNSKTNIIATMQNLKNAGYSPQQIGDILHNVGLDQLNIPGLNVGKITGVTSTNGVPTAVDLGYQTGKTYTFSNGNVPQGAKPIVVMGKPTGQYYFPK